MPYYGKFRGVVVNAADPMSKGRLQVSVPAVMGGAAAWATACVPYPTGGARFGVPPVGSSVWVEFEAGNVDHPIWSGWIPG